jgi:hypothetical protein
MRRHACLKSDLHGRVAVQEYFDRARNHAVAQRRQRRDPQVRPAQLPDFLGGLLQTIEAEIAAAYLLIEARPFGRDRDPFFVALEESKPDFALEIGKTSAYRGLRDVEEPRGGRNASA